MTTTLPPPGELPEIPIDPAAFRHLADAQVNVELDTGDMVLNIGPQHPATHGTLRLVVRVGETSGSSVAAIRTKEDEERRESAAQSIEADPFVRELVRDFGAEVVASSIKPTEEGKRS